MSVTVKSRIGRKHNLHSRNILIPHIAPLHSLFITFGMPSKVLRRYILTVLYLNYMNGNGKEMFNSKHHTLHNYMDKFD